MKTKLSRKDTQEKINSFFERKDFAPEEMKKIKRLAMKFNIKLGNYRKSFCKKCLNPLKGKTRVTKFFRIVECGKCRQMNRHKINVRRN